MKQKFIEWFTKNNNGCSPAMEDDRSFVHEKTQHMFEAYQAGVAEGEARCAALAAENAGLKSFGDKLDEMHKELNGEGTGIQGRAEVACQQVALEATMEEFDAIKTPATDAFLAEVRASGVEMFAAHKRERQQALRSRSMRMSEEAAGMAADAEDFAAQLRKGVQS